MSGDYDLKKHPFLVLLLSCTLAASCNGQQGAQHRWSLFAKAGRDTTAVKVSADSVASKTLLRFPDTTYASVEALQWFVEVKDTTDDGLLKYLEDPYEALCGGCQKILCDNFQDAPGPDSSASGHKSVFTGIFTFRGNQRRDMPLTGRISGTPSEISYEWIFTTASDTTCTPYGVWYGGAGWTGQPVYVHWSDSAAASFRAISPALTRNFAEREIIAGSLCGDIYFLNYETGMASREAIYSGNIIKGSVSLDPCLPNLYVGHGVQKPGSDIFGNITIDLEHHCITTAFGCDHAAWRNWGAYDGCAVVAGGYLFRTGENGTLYKYRRQKGSLHTISKLRYKERGASSAAGIESSLAVCRNYGYFSDNRGNILCVNLDTMVPVWRYDNHDDTDATPVIEETGGRPYLYTCSELDKLGNEGDIFFVKLDGLTGEPVWTLPLPCRAAINGEKRFEGGMFATPLPGRGDCKDLIYINICDHNPSLAGFVASVDRSSGQILWQTRLKHYSWSSPLAFCNEEGRMYLCVADCAGNIYLMDAKSGQIIFSKRFGNNFEASGIAVDDCIVIPSRGNQIIKLRVK